VSAPFGTRITFLIPLSFKVLANPVVTHETKIAFLYSFVDIF